MFWINCWNQLAMCSSRKYPYFPYRRDFFNTSPPLWKFQLSFIHFFKFFGLPDPPSPPLRKFQSLLWGSMDIFWNCTIETNAGNLFSCKLIITSSVKASIQSLPVES